MFPLRWVILEDVPIKVGCYVLADFIILDTAEDACIQIILSRPFLAITGWNLDAKRGSLTFDVGEYRAAFGLFEDIFSLLWL